MIDIEPEVFSQVSKSLRNSFKSIYFTNEYVRTPPKFPAASLEQMDSRNDYKTQDSGSNENSDTVMFTANVYSNKSTGKKAECKQIMESIDREMLALGFTRMMLQPTPNLDDATIYRLTARYTAVVDKEHRIYGR